MLINNKFKSNKFKFKQKIDIKCWKVLINDKYKYICLQHNNFKLAVPVHALENDRMMFLQRDVHIVWALGAVII